MPNEDRLLSRPFKPDLVCLRCVFGEGSHEPWCAASQPMEIVIVLDNEDEDDA